MMMMMVSKIVRIKGFFFMISGSLVVKKEKECKKFFLKKKEGSISRDWRLYLFYSLPGNSVRDRGGLWDGLLNWDI